MTKRASTLLEQIAQATKEINHWPEWKKTINWPEQESEEAFQQRKAAQRAYSYWPED